MDPDAGDDVVGLTATVHTDRRRTGVAIVLVVVVLAGAALAVYREQHAFLDSFRRIGLGTMLASYVLGLAGVAATFPVWRQVLGGLGVDMPWGAGSRVFFVSQLGKYLPGSVWPVMMQMEAGHNRGAARRTMLVANLASILICCCVGLVIGCLLLPFHDTHALERYWWALLALPLLLAVLHPRTMPAVLDRLCALLGRPPLGERLDGRSEIRASAWSVVSWAALGAHLAILCASQGHGGLSTFVLATGSMAFAFSLGVLFIPAPAGAGIRDVVLVLALGVVLTTGQALAVVVASRVILIACDLTLAGATAITRGRLGWSH